MEMYLQLGHGMMKHAEVLIEEWNGGTAILSPRDLTLKQMKELTKKIQKNNGEVIFDPQFYLPRSDHDKLTAHEYWPDAYATNNFFNSHKDFDMLSVIYNEYIKELNAKYFILPGLFIERINEDWFKWHEKILNNDVSVKSEIEKFATLALSENTLLSQDAIHAILERIEEWQVDGYYIVPEHPKNNYLVDNPNWLINLLDLCAGLKKLNKKVIVGYSNHQNLILALAKVDAIASGSWVNVRTFTTKRFNKTEEGTKQQRSTWYYCPQALSEYQISFLGIAYKLNILGKMKANESLCSQYADILFRGADPLDVMFSETEAFRHYLQSLHQQTNQINQSSFDTTYNMLKIILETAQEITEYLRDNGIRGKYRDFSDVVDATIASIDVFKKIRGLNFSAIWDTI